MTSNQSSNNLILDGRSIDKYDKEHIDGSYHVSLPQILIKRITTKPEKFIDFLLNQDLITKFKEITKDKSEKIYYLIDTNFSETLRNSLESFYNEIIQFIMYDEYKIQNKDQIKLVQTIHQSVCPIIKSPQHTPDMCFEMSEIIPGLYLGGEEVAKNNKLLKKNNVSTILNITIHIPFYHETEFEYHRVPIIDDPSVDIKQYFDETFKIIDETIRNNKQILIHCQAGISRSVTIVIAYIMKKYNIKMNEAYKIVHKSRPCISPNLGFCGQLMLYEKELIL